MPSAVVRDADHPIAGARAAAPARGPRAGADPPRAPLAIRPAHIGEAWDAAAVGIRSVRAGYAGFMPRPYLEALSIDATAQRRRAAHAGGRLLMLVATRGGRPVGLLNGGPSAGPQSAPGAGEIYSLFLDPAEFGSGAADALFAAGVRALRRRGFRELTLWVLERNRRARRFYAAHGWRPDGGRSTARIYGYRTTELRYRSPAWAGSSPSNASAASASPSTR